MTSCEVLVAGAGPTGLMLANWLVELGVDVIVADGKDGPTRQSRAVLLQARSLEIYEQLGLGATVGAAANRAVALAPGFESRVFGRIPLGPLGTKLTPYPFLEVLEQSRNEQILYDHLRERGGKVRWGAEVTGLREADGGVVATVGGAEVLARFVVGADGADSVVRRARGIAFEGVTNPHRFFVVDATATAGLVGDAVNVRPGRNGFLITFPMAGRGNTRLIGVAPDGDVTEDEVRAQLRDSFAVTWGDSRWFATYRVHHRVAAAFRDGPFLLAGDAAHVHSPVGGQGMNTGLQDAHNLAFKLADVLRGRAGDAWLDRYQAERRPVAQRLVATTDRLFGFITSTNPVARAARRAIVPLLAPVGVRTLPATSGGSLFFQYVSQIRIHYRMPDTPEGRDPVVGRRLPWAGANFAALRSRTWQIHGYGQSEAPDLGLPVHLFPPAPDTLLDPAVLYLVRPDGFVAARATPADAGRVFRSVMRGSGLRTEDHS